MAISSFYFNASDAALSDPNSAWTNDENAFDGSITTAATTTLTGDTATNFLLGQGTDAPSTGGTITSVSARVYGQGQNSGGFAGPQTSASIYTIALGELLGTPVTIASTAAQWGLYVVLSAPAAGWTWQTVNNLQVKLYTLSGSLGTCTARKVEVQVTFTHSAPGNHGPYVIVGDGLSRAEVAN